MRPFPRECGRLQAEFRPDDYGGCVSVNSREKRRSCSAEGGDVGGRPPLEEDKIVVAPPVKTIERKLTE